MKIADKLARLRRIAPKTSPHGQLYATLAQTRGRYYRVAMHVMLVSTENTHSIHETIFKKAEAKTPAQWDEWFNKNFEAVYTEGILPGINLRTGKRWSVQKLLGWVADAEFKARSTKTPARRNKTGKKGGQNGQTNLRRRQRNAKR